VSKKNNKNDDRIREDRIEPGENEIPIEENNSPEGEQVRIENWEIDSKKADAGEISEKENMLPAEEAAEQIEAAPAAEDIELKYKELEDRYLRLMAEFDNYRKRTSREFGELVKSANRELLLQLLPVIDHFRLALESETNEDTLENFRKGIGLIHKEIKAFMERMDLTEIEAVGEKFDPGYHEAVMQVHDDDHEEGVIINEIQKGYMLGDRILRPSKVVISAGPRDDNAESVDGDDSPS
jgi:molecular chaperone GrpE